MRPSRTLCHEVPLTTLCSTSFLAEYWIHRPTGPWSRPVPPIVHMSTCHHTSAHLIAADGSLSPVSCPGEVNNANISLNICVVLMERLFVGNFMLQQHWLWLHKQGPDCADQSRKYLGPFIRAAARSMCRPSVGGTLRNLFKTIISSEWGCPGTSITNRGHKFWNRYYKKYFKKL